jgi:hypothetical protein
MPDLCTTASECFKEPFTINWSSFYSELNLDMNTCLITSSTWQLISGPGVLGANSIDTPETTVNIEASSALSGDEILVENTIQVDNGAFQDCRTLKIEVE